MTPTRRQTPDTLQQVRFLRAVDALISAADAARQERDRLLAAIHERPGGAVTEGQRR